MIFGYLLRSSTRVTLSVDLVLLDARMCYPVTPFDHEYGLFSFLPSEINRHDYISSHSREVRVRLEAVGRGGKACFYL